jgi:hypothetical protein
VIQLAEKALAGEQDIGPATQLISRLKREEAVELREAAHLLMHFISDSDLRSRDKEYDRLQREQLEKSLSKLKL